VETPENNQDVERSLASPNTGARLSGRDQTEALLMEVKVALDRRTEELVQQREWFRVTLSSIGDAVITTDVEKKVTFLNLVAETMTGWKSADAVGQPLDSVFKLIHEKTRLSEQSPVRKALREGAIVGLANHTILLARNGSETAIEDSAAPIRDSAGHVAGAIMVFHDVTERRRVEAALRTSHDQFSAIVNHSPLRVFLVDSHLRIRQTNAKAQFAFGGVENLVGRELAEVLNILWPPHVAAQMVAHFRHTLETGEPFFESGFSEVRLDNESREYYDWEVHRVTLPDDQRGVTCYFIDISSHVLAQQALIERSRLVALRAEIGTTLAGSENLQGALQLCAQALVTHLDGAFARIWIVNEAENVLELQASAGCYTHLNGLHSRVKIGEHIIGRIAQERQPLTTNDVVHAENLTDTDWVRKEGMIAFAGYPLILKDRVIGVMALFARHTLTDNVLVELAPIADNLAQWVRRRRAEEALGKVQRELQQYTTNLEQAVEERTAQLREKIGELEAFSYTISHDMRSPLRAMQGYATVLLADHQQNLNEEGRHYLDRIHKAAARMDLLIQEVLTYSRVAKEELTFYPTDLEKLISEILQSYPALQPPEAIITIQSPLPKVLGHEAFLTQTISNLLGNAVKFVRPHVTPHILIHAETKEGMVRVWFDDNGIGIDPLHFNRIFEIFGRVYGEKQFKGTGIGLAIAKKAVERMGGKIGVESQLGQGSRFWFTVKPVP
jgi:PAS domain S-box-containing protein